jgi:hypothetical protein
MMVTSSFRRACSQAIYSNVERKTSTYAGMSGQRRMGYHRLQRFCNEVRRHWRARSTSACPANVGHATADNASDALNFGAMRLPNRVLPRRKFMMRVSSFPAWRSACVVVLAGLAVLLSGCAAMSPAPSGTPTPPAGTPAPRSAPAVNLSGYPPAFKEGFNDGCESFRGNYRRDARRFGKDNDYTLGWQDGHSICARQQKR